MYEQDDWKKIEMQAKDMEFIKNNPKPNPFVILINIVGFLI